MGTKRRFAWRVLMCAHTLAWVTASKIEARTFQLKQVPQVDSACIPLLASLLLPQSLFFKDVWGWLPFAVPNNRAHDLRLQSLTFQNALYNRERHPPIHAEVTLAQKIISNWSSLLPFMEWGLCQSARASCEVSWSNSVKQKTGGSVGQRWPCTLHGAIAWFHWP